WRAPGPPVVPYTPRSRSMSSSTDASSGSSRWVYCVRPAEILPRSLVNAACSRSSAPGPVTRTVPRWLTSKTAASVRHAWCSASVPVGYWIGISQPPNGTIFAPSARWRLSSGDVLRVTAAEATSPAGAASRRSAALARRPAGCARPGRGLLAVAGGEQLDDGGVDLVLHAVEREQVENALPLVADDDVDELVVLAHEHGAVAGDDQLGGGEVLAELVAQVAEGFADGLELDAVVQQRLDELELEQVPVAVAAPRAAALGVGQGGTDEVGAGPVVELAIGDADDVGRLLAAERLDGGVGGLAHCVSYLRGDTSGITSMSRPRRVRRRHGGVNASGREVLGVHVVDELAELLDHLLGLLLVGLLDAPGLVEDLLLGVDRRPDADGQGDGVGRAAGHRAHLALCGE